MNAETIGRARAVLTDIEGTTSSIAFVTDTLFPYARARLADYVATHAAEVAPVIAGVPGDKVATLLRWMDEDAKETPLKALQGMIWADGYKSADFTSHMYPDAAPALRQWKEQGLRLYVYSSGSVPAQRLLFGHSDAGDLTELFSGWFDTEVGGKREAASYERIVESIGLPAHEILFLSDVIEELDAAREAGLETVLIDRLDDYPTPREGAATNDHPRATSFDQIEV